MSISNKTINEVQNSDNYCSSSFEISGKAVVNTYKCYQRAFSSSDMWNIQKSRKELSVRTYNL